jgi:hypothetical protein
MAKCQICFTVDEKTAKELEELKEETGLPLSKIIELRLKGYVIKKER